MKYLLVFFLSITLTLSVSSCKDAKNSSKVLTKEITFKKEGRLIVYKKNTEAITTIFDIETAEDEYETQTGLMYRKSMPRDAGMLFIFEDSQPRAFYMKNTEFPLDIVYINADKVIEKIYTMTTPMDPTSLPSNVPIKYVLEVNGAVTSSLGILAGDRVEWDIE